MKDLKYHILSKKILTELALESNLGMAAFYLKFERAIELLHATTIVKSPNVLDGQRSGLVLFRHFTRGQVNERFKMRALQKFAS